MSAEQSLQDKLNSSEDVDILPRLKGLPKIHQNVDDIYAHLLERHSNWYPEDGSHLKWIDPQVIILFESGDLEQVVNIVVNDLKHPIGKGLVSSVLVHEPLYPAFIKSVRCVMEPMDDRIVQHPNFLHTQRLIERMNCKCIYMKDYDVNDEEKKHPIMKCGSPIVVLDYPQIYFGDRPSAVITVNTFRSANEAVELCQREGLKFKTVSVWTAKFTQGYVLVFALSQFPNFQINCINVPFRVGGVLAVKNNFHYETISVNGQTINIIFPIKHK